MSESYKKAKRLALGSLLSGLSFAALYLGAVSGVFDLCAVVVGALCTAFAVIELGGAYPYLICAVTGVLGILLLPDRMAAVEYIFLGGIYPIIKSYIERLRFVVAFPLKLLYFNAVLTAAILLARYVFSAGAEWDFLSVAAYVAGNVFFVIYDYAMTVFISVYLMRLRGKLKIKNLR